MHSKLLQFRAALLTLLFATLVVAPSAAQVQYASHVVNSYSVSQEPQAVDGSATTAATLVTPLIGNSMLRVGFPSTAPSGSPAGLLIQPNSNINVGLLNNIIVSTYMKTSAGTSMMESFPLNQLLTLNLQSSSPTVVSFTPKRYFNQIELSVGGLLNAGMSVDFFTAFAGVSPLPVVLTAFQGKVTAGGVALTWETASERNTDHFVVERASGSPADFQALGQVQSGGNSTQALHYQFVDAMPSGLNYYRLRQVDLNGEETFSPVVAVKASQTSTGLVAYPSPATETLTIAGPVGAHVGVFDQLGRQVQQTQLSFAQGQQLDVRSLPNGVYYLQNTATGERTKFVKAGGLRE